MGSFFITLLQLFSSSRSKAKRRGGNWSHSPKFRDGEVGLRYATQILQPLLFPQDEPSLTPFMWKMPNGGSKGRRSHQSGVFGRCFVWGLLACHSMNFRLKMPPWLRVAEDWGMFYGADRARFFALLIFQFLPSLPVYSSLKTTTHLTPF